MLKDMDKHDDDEDEEDESQPAGCPLYESWPTLIFLFFFTHGDTDSVN